MFFIASASVKHHYIFTSWDSVEANGVTFQWDRTVYFTLENISGLLDWAGRGIVRIHLAVPGRKRAALGPASSASTADTSYILHHILRHQ